MTKKTSRVRFVTVCMGLIALLLSACSTTQMDKPMESKKDIMENQWGVHPVGIRLVGGDHFIDFRYRVVDPEKAVTLLSRNHQPYLVDEATGKVHTVPVTKLGPMRSSAIKPKADRNYVILFGNTQRIIHKGSKVTVVIGDFRAEHMTIM